MSYGQDQKWDFQNSADAKEDSSPHSNFRDLFFYESRLPGLGSVDQFIPTPTQFSCMSREFIQSSSFTFLYGIEACRFFVELSWKDI